MFPLITTKIKDDILNWLCANIPLGEPSDINCVELENKIGINSDALGAILDDFAEMGLIDSLIVLAEEGGLFIVTLKLKAHSLVQTGGFAIIDALNEANIQKLLFELDSLRKQLKPDQLDTYNKIASIISSIATVLTAYSGKE